MGGTSTSCALGERTVDATFWEMSWHYPQMWNEHSSPSARRKCCDNLNGFLLLVSPGDRLSTWWRSYPWNTKKSEKRMKEMNLRCCGKILRCTGYFRFLGWAGSLVWCHGLFLLWSTCSRALGLSSRGAGLRWCHSTWGLSSPTRDRTSSPALAGRVLATGPPG